MIVSILDVTKERYDNNEYTYDDVNFEDFDEGYSIEDFYHDRADVDLELIEIYGNSPCYVYRYIEKVEAIGGNYEIEHIVEFEEVNNEE